MEATIICIHGTQLKDKLVSDDGSAFVVFGSYCCTERHGFFMVSWRDDDSLKLHKFVQETDTENKPV